MPVRILKPVPVAEAQPAPSAPLTRDDVQQMLAARDAEWMRRLQAMTDSFTSALAAVKPQPAPTRKGARIKFTYDNHGAITGADVLPKDQ
jgi:hypothetical protein